MAWAKIPTGWIIHDGKLRSLSWQTNKSDATAALIVLITLSIRCNQLHTNQNVVENTATFTDSYDRLQSQTLLSRAKISAGLHLLKSLGIIEIVRAGRMNHYSLPGINEKGKWAQLPQTQILTTGVFKQFTLRHQNELNALKLYLLLLAFRSNASKYAMISYEKIGEWSGLERKHVASAVSLLVNLALIYCERHEPENGQPGHPHNRYKIRGL